MRFGWLHWCEVRENRSVGSKVVDTHTDREYGLITVFTGAMKKIFTNCTVPLLSIKFDRIA